MKRGFAYWILAALFILLGLLLPRGWYDALPRPPEIPVPPISGVALLQVIFVIEGLAFIWLAATRWSFTHLADAERLPPPPDTPGDRGLPTHWYLAAITALGLGLRLWHLSSDLWIDEITTVETFSRMPVLQIFGTYLSPNNHMLNTLLVKLSVAMFGEKEWAVRLPAVLFGTATIPAIFWVGRLALSRQASLGGALLLSVSYYHIFYSQNARGYTAYVLFSLLASGLFVRGFQEDRLKIWVLYIVTMLLDFASLLTSGYVFAAHMIVGAMAVLVLKRNGHPPAKLTLRLVGVFAVVGLLVFQLYATVLPEALVVTQQVFTKAGSGYAVFSADFLKEIARGASTGLGAGVLLAATPLVAMVGIGYAILLKRQWALTLALTLPEILLIVVFTAKGLGLSPRFLLLGLPLALLAAVQGAFAVGELVARIGGSGRRISPSRVGALIVLMLSIVSAISLRPYYAAPKQAYRASIQYLETTRKPGDIVIVLFLADGGYRYYGDRLGLQEGKDYFVARTATAFDDILSKHKGARALLVTTLPHFLHLAAPELDARVRAGWTRVRVFPGTIGDGNITVWSPR